MEKLEMFFLSENALVAMLVQRNQKSFDFCLQPVLFLLFYIGDFGFTFINA